MLLSIFNKNIVELHHPPTGLTNLIFIIYRFFRLDKNLDYIFLHKNLKKELKINKGLVLDDAVDYNDFKKIKKKILKNSVMLEVYSRAKALKPLKN